MSEITKMAFVLPAGRGFPSDNRMLVRQRHGHQVVIVTMPADVVDDVLGDTSGELITARRREDVPEATWGALGASERLALEGYAIATYVVRITIPANPNAPDLEALWRDPAMAALGYPGGLGSVTGFAQALKIKNFTDSAYVFFFTRYPLLPVAYAPGATTTQARPRPRPARQWLSGNPIRRSEAHWTVLC